MVSELGQIFCSNLVQQQSSVNLTLLSFNSCHAGCPEQLEVGWRRLGGGGHAPSVPYSVVSAAGEF